MIIIKYILLFIGVVSLLNTSAQNIGINSTGVNPDNSAMLDVVATDKGLLIPRVALVATNSNTPIVAPTVSLLVYNTVTASGGTTEVTPGYYYWTGSEWTKFNTGGGGASSGWELTGNASTNAATNFIGTTDNNNLSFRTNDVIKMVLTTRGQLVPTNTGNSVLIGNNAGSNDDFSNNNNIFIGANTNTNGATNENSIAIGSSASFNANNSVAVGSGVINQGANTTSVGFSSDARNTNATSIGYEAFTNSMGGTAIGANSGCQGEDAISIGKGTFTSALNSIAIGVSSNSQSTNSISVGPATFTGNGNFNSAFGSNAQAQGGNATAIGYQAGAFAANTVRIGNGAVSSIGGAVNFTMVSDGRFKRGIKESTLGLNFIKGLEPVTYYFDVDSLFKFNQISTEELDEEMIRSIQRKELILQYGFIAQDVHKLSEELGAEFSGVDIPQNDQSYYGLRYAEFVVPLVKAVQEQQEMIDFLLEKVELSLKEIELLKSKE